MALTTVPLLREDSIICWEKETTFKTAPAAATWKSLGRVEEWADIGPRNNVFREAIAGSGRQAATIGANGLSYGPATIGPFQIVDPKFLGFAWGREINAPSALGGGRYLHTVSPTNAGQLPSMSLQMADYKAGSRVDGTTFLGVIMPRLSLRGEATNEDGSGGRILAAPTFLAHDEDPAVAAKAVTLPTEQPYFFSHANNAFSSDADWRINSWEFSLDNHATPAYYHVTPATEKPTESPPEGITYEARLEIVADGHTDATFAELIRDLVRSKRKFPVTFGYVRTAMSDFFNVRLTDFMIESAYKVRRQGRIAYDVVGYARTSEFQFADDDNARYFPA